MGPPSAQGPELHGKRSASVSELLPESAGPLAVPPPPCPRGRRRARAGCQRRQDNDSHRKEWSFALGVCLSFSHLIRNPSPIRSLPVGFSRASGVSNSAKPVPFKSRVGVEVLPSASRQSISGFGPWCMPSAAGEPRHHFGSEILQILEGPLKGDARVGELDEQVVQVAHFL